jgi:hypothetical protein
MSEREKIPASIATALAKAQAKVTRVGKDGTNTFHRYRYTSAEMIIESAIGVMGSEGLALAQYGWDVTAAVGEMPARIVVRYALTHVSGESWEMPPSSTPVIPEKGRPWDKAEAAALTYSLGYTLRGLLKIPRADPDDDVDQRDDEPVSHAPRRDSRADVARLCAAYDGAMDEVMMAIAKADRQGVWDSLDPQSRETVGKHASAARARLDRAKADTAATRDER